MSTSSPLDSVVQPTIRSIGIAPGSYGRRFARALYDLYAWCAESRSRRQDGEYLARMSDRALRDIGLLRVGGRTFRSPHDHGEGL